MGSLCWERYSVTNTYLTTNSHSLTPSSSVHPRVTTDPTLCLLWSHTTGQQSVVLPSLNSSCFFYFGRHCCKVPRIIIPRPSGKEQGKVTPTPNSGRCHHNCLSLWFHSAALKFLPRLNSLGSKTEKCSETTVGRAALLFVL